MTAVYRINYLARRHPRLTHEDWVRRWRDHWRLADRQPESATVRRYIQCEVIHDTAAVPHDGVATAEYFCPDARRSNRTATDYHRLMRADEEQVFDRLIERCSFIGEHRVLSGAGTGPFKVVRYLKRRPDVPPATFVAAWRGSHASRILESTSDLLSYAQNQPVAPERPAGWGLDVDGSEELWFADADTATAYAKSAVPPEPGPFTVVAQVVTNEVILKDVRDASRCPVHGPAACESAPDADS